MSKVKVKNNRLGRGLGSLLGDHADDSKSSILEENQKTNSDTSSAKAALAEEAKNKESENKKTETEVKVVEKIVEKIVEKPVIQEKIVHIEKKLPEGARVWRIAIDKLKPNRLQPRQVFESSKLEELADSIREQGILQPIVARKSSDEKTFEIISGERRWRAAQLAGKHDVPVIIRSVEDQQSLELALIENIQRANLNPVEEAEAYQRLAEDYDLTQVEVAKKVGKDRSSVANALRILVLPREVKDLIASKQISMGHAKALLTIEDPVQQKAIARKIVSEKLSVRQIEALTKSKRSGKANAKVEVEDLDAFKNQMSSLTDEIQKNLGTKVIIDYSKGKGKFTIHFHSQEQFDELVERLKI